MTKSKWAVNFRELICNQCSAPFSIHTYWFNTTNISNKLFSPSKCQIARNKSVKKIHGKRLSIYLASILCTLIGWRSHVAFFFFRSLNKCKCCQWCVKHFTMHLMFLNLGFPFSPLCCLTSLAINWCESFFIEGKRMMPQYLTQWSSVALCSFVSTEIQAIKKKEMFERVYAESTCLCSVHLCQFWFHRFRAGFFSLVNSCQCQTHHSKLLRVNRCEWRNHL